MSNNNNYQFPDTCICGNSEFTTCFIYDRPPEVETKFFPQGIDYHRETKSCSICYHFISVTEMDIDKLYEGEYVDKKYRDFEGLKNTLSKISQLPPEKSDNAGRVERVNKFINSYAYKKKQDITVLDVGSGLCVFLNKLKEFGYTCTALDPDQRTAELAQKVVGINAICADFTTYDNIGTYDLITFNKVLEHVKDPISMLRKALSYLAQNGIVYMELPDGEMAQHDGKGRQEFAIDHHHVFSSASINYLAIRSGYEMILTGRLRDPSGKYTIWSFIRPSGNTT